VRHGKRYEVWVPSVSNRTSFLGPPFSDKNLNRLCEQGEFLIHATLELIHFASDSSDFR
jgi:hypothetical protein